MLKKANERWSSSSEILLDSPGRRNTFLKPFNSLIGRATAGILFAYVELSNFFSRALAGIADPEAHSYKSLSLSVAQFLSFGSPLPVVILLRRFNIQVRVRKARVAQRGADAIGIDFSAVLDRPFSGKLHTGTEQE